jgi:hypothetical protein
MRSTARRWRGQNGNRSTGRFCQVIVTKCIVYTAGFEDVINLNARVIRLEQKRPSTVDEFANVSDDQLAIQVIIFGRAKVLAIGPRDAPPVRRLFDARTPPMSQFPQSRPPGQMFPSWRTFLLQQPVSAKRRRTSKTHALTLETMQMPRCVHNAPLLRGILGNCSCEPFRRPVTGRLG